MIGAGTTDLARVLAGVATYCVRADTRCIRVFDKDGVLLAQGGAVQRDGAAEFAWTERGLEIGGLPATRIVHEVLVELPAAQDVWLVLTDDTNARSGELAEFAGELASAFERIAFRDYEAEDTTRHLLSCFEQIRAVHDLADRLPDCETSNEMARLCLESLLLALGVRIGAIVLREGRSETARAFLMGEAGKREWTADLEVSRAAGAKGPLSQALEDGKVRYGSVGSFEIMPGTLEAEALDWLLLVPICFGSEPDTLVLGCIVLMDRNEADASKGSPFGNPEAELAQSVSVLLGLALGTRMRVSAEKELQIAQAIQATLIPTAAPSWKGVDLAGRNRSANQVGGDYFDYLTSGDGSRHVVIADVSGHNMASAMAMVMARSQLRAVVAQETEPARVLDKLAADLYDDLVRNELFITIGLLTLGDCNEEGLTLRYANAGHNPPLVIRRDGRVEWLTGGGPMVGFLRRVSYEEYRLVLEPGDLFVLYTDGVTEVANRDEEMLDESGLVEVVRAVAGSSAQQILNRIFRAVDAHAGSRIGEDDVTAVVVKLAERVGDKEPAGRRCGRLGGGAK